MKTLLPLLIISMLLVGAVAQDDSPYKVEIRAKLVSLKPDHDAPVLTVQARITETKKNGDVLSAPIVTLLDGSEAHIAIGQERPQSTTAPANSPPGAIYSGLTIDFTKPLNKPEVLVVTKIFKDGQIVWTDATWSKIEPLGK